MIKIDYPNSPSEEAKNINDALNKITRLTDKEWIAGSGVTCLINESTGYYISIKKHPKKTSYMFVSAPEFGDAEMVFRLNENYTDSVQVFIEGNEAFYPEQFFWGFDDIHHYMLDFFNKGFIDYDKNWAILHLQEWPGML